MDQELEKLAHLLHGELFWDQKMRLLYATDASAYRELPLAVAIPRSKDDIKQLIHFARVHNTSLIPRAAGTSLAGQVVGSGIIVDISKHFTNILEVNREENWVRVEPGVIRDELNLFLKAHHLYFGPETSTANRAMIGGMVGNNSCGSNSLIYGSVRDHALAVDVIMSDGSEVTFSALNFEEFTQKCLQQDFEGQLYQQIRRMLGDYGNQVQIRTHFPDPVIKRRNTGYAVDALLESDPFTAGGDPFNFCKLLCGSEGTLAFITAVKLHVNALPDLSSGLLCIHFNSLQDALKGNLVALKHHPLCSELMDHYILECTKANLEQIRNRFFIKDDPKAILIIEFAGKTQEEIQQKADLLELELKGMGLGYHFPLVLGEDKQKVWTLRKAGLGLLTNVIGDEKPVSVIEDTAVRVEDLPQYIEEFNEILLKYNLYAVHYAHAATGELHLRPIINLKTTAGNELFRKIAVEIAHLVKKYRGSLSGEHGDGRLRGEFIPLMIGAHNYDLLKQIKAAWDPNGIFNPGKIVDTPRMNEFLRFTPAKQYRSIDTVFRFNGQSILQHAEQCNGSGDCRKTHLTGGTMCPSYMATKDEKDTTRARANMLREMLTNSTQQNPFDHPELNEVMDLCLSCKACKSECPSSVDMAKLKAEFLQAYYDTHGVPLRSRMIGHVDKLTQLMQPIAGLYNWFITNKLTGKLIKHLLGFSPKRSIPKIASTTLYSWFVKKNKREKAVDLPLKSVYFFCDEFTNFNDVEIGKQAIALLEGLGYQVLLIPHAFSGRALISKGLLREAKKLANKNVKIFGDLLSNHAKLVAVEPSTILTFRDEYPDLVDADLIGQANRIAPLSLCIEEFIYEEYLAGNISSDHFESKEMDVVLHGHCQQKAWGIQAVVDKILTIPSNYKVTTIPSGCCGMAGSFGYEKEHYQLSMQIGELVLFPFLRAKAEKSIIAAPGASCRHQIKDGTGQEALHPVQILYRALLKNS